MALQSDATVNYVTGKKTPQISAEDLELDSPYNTYKHKGLTPGPISNPGLTALQAAIQPEEHDFFYFLNNLETGKAYYGKNQDEHLENRRKYLD